MGQRKPGFAPILFLQGPYFTSSEYSTTAYSGQAYIKRSHIQGILIDYILRNKNNNQGHKYTNALILHEIPMSLTTFCYHA